MLGAAGVLIGTRFWATPEALGPDSAKELLIRAKGGDTLRTRVFDTIRELDWPEGYSGRASANDFTAKWHGHEADLVPRVAELKDQWWAAQRTGDTRQAVVFAGEGVDLITSIRPAGDVVRDIAAEAEGLLRGSGHFRIE